MDKDVDVPTTKEMYFNLKRDYFDNKKIVADGSFELKVKSIVNRVVKIRHLLLKISV